MRGTETGLGLPLSPEEGGALGLGWAEIDDLPFADHAKIRAVFPKKRLRLIGCLWSAGPDHNVSSPDSSDITNELPDPVNIPDIGGKSDDIGMTGHDSRKDILIAVIDREFSCFDHSTVTGIFHRKRFQAVDGGTCMDIFGIYGNKKNFHHFYFILTDSSPVRTI